MEKNGITAAPQTGRVADLHQAWLEGHNGTLDEFYAFMTTPSAERTAFLASRPCETEVTSRMLIPTYS